MTKGLGGASGPGARPAGRRQTALTLARSARGSVSGGAAGGADGWLMEMGLWMDGGVAGEGDGEGMQSKPGSLKMIISSLRVKKQ